MMGLILRCLEQNEQTEPSILSKNERLKQAVQLIITYIENNYAQEITIEQLATTHYVSPTYLSKIFKEVTGVSPINYLILIRLQQARQLLMTEEYPIKEIARAVGYEDAYHFSKSFKKQYGVSPSALRQKNSQEMPR
jgi:AraC-like DNA-binding protein